MEGALRQKRQRDELSDDPYSAQDLKQGRVTAAEDDNSGSCNIFPDYYYCVLDKDWECDDGRGEYGIRGMAIRKQDGFNDGGNKSEEEDLGLDGGEMIKELWRAESPLCEGGTEEPLFGDYYHLGLEEETASVFRFWEEDDDREKQTVHGKDEYEYDEELFAESVELQLCAPSL